VADYSDRGPYPRCWLPSLPRECRGHGEVTYGIEGNYARRLLSAVKYCDLEEKPMITPCSVAVGKYRGFIEAALLIAH
jgi:hypothetical protein